MLAECSQRRRLQPLDLELDVQKSLIPVASQHLFQQCQFTKMGAIGLRDCEAVKLRIVAQHSKSIGGASHIEFEAIGAMLQCEIKRRNRVLRRGCRTTRAAVA